MSKTVMLYLDIEAINIINQSLENIVNDQNILSKIIRLFSSSKIQYTPINNTASIYFWKNIKWTCNRPEIMYITDILSSLETKRYFLSIQDNTTQEIISIGSLYTLNDSIIRQGIIPYAIKQIVFE